jgi:HAD superfamily phosphoserine phosphatase-like hydrolase
MKHQYQEVSLFDWDGTLRANYTILDWTIQLIKENFLDELVLNSLKKIFKEYQSQTLTYTSLVTNTADVYAKSIAGVNESDLAIQAEIFASNDKNIFPFVNDLIKFLHSKNIEVIVISGTPSIVLNAFTSKLGIDQSFGLDLDKTPNGIYNGNIVKNHGLFSYKKKLVEKFLAEDKNIIFGVGNSKSDFPLLENAMKGFILEPIGDISKTNICLSSPEKIFNEIKMLLD